MTKEQKIGEIIRICSEIPSESWQPVEYHSSWKAILNGNDIQLNAQAVDGKGKITPPELVINGITVIYCSRMLPKVAELQQILEYRYNSKHEIDAALYLLTKETTK